MHEIRIGILQLRNKKCVDDNKKKIAENITDLAQRGAQLIVLQELHNSLYFCPEGSSSCPTRFTVMTGMPLATACPR